MLGNMFAEGDWVQNNLGEIGKIHRRGVNYVIAVTEEGNMFRSWVKDIKEYYNDTEEKMGITDKEKVQRFINKNKRQKTNDN